MSETAEYHGYLAWQCEMDNIISKQEYNLLSLESGTFLLRTFFMEKSPTF